MTRRLVYGSSLFAFLFPTAFTLVAIIIPRWISWDSETPTGEHIHYTYGLSRRCSSLIKSCSSFPGPEDCANDRYFCSMWRSVGFVMSFAVVMEGMTMIAYVMILAGAKQKRANGWKVLASLHLFVAALLGIAMSIIAYLYDHDDRFFPGWKLDMSWIFCTVGFVATLLIGGGISAAATLLPSEGGYELIPSHDDD